MEANTMSSSKDVKKPEEKKPISRSNPPAKAKPIQAAPAHKSATPQKIPSKGH
jgi:hypothetical protein